MNKKNCTTKYLYPYDNSFIVLTFNVKELQEELNSIFDKFNEELNKGANLKLVGGALINDYMTKKQQLVLKYHDNQITNPGTTGRRWQTYVGHGRTNRKLVQGNTYNELIDKLYEIYSTLGKKENITFEECYEKWIILKEETTSSANASRLGNDYDKFISSLSFNKMKMKDITKTVLETDCNKMVKSYNMTTHKWRNVKTIINGVFAYAYDNEYISSDLSKMIKISARFAQDTKPSSQKQIFDKDEMRNLFMYLDTLYEKDKTNTALMCVKFDFFLGLRVGELVALKWDDIVDDNIYIQREEICDKKNKKYYVANHTKTHRARLLVLPEEAQNILKEIPRTGEYIFERNGQRLTSRQINYVLEKYAERTGNTKKSSHKIRKTVASLLDAGGAPLEMIREVLGHSNTATTDRYLYDPTPKAEARKMINNILVNPLNTDKKVSA